MRALLTSLTVAAALAASSVAFAAGMMATGTIRAVDTKAMTLTLKNGSKYMLPAALKDQGLKVGEKVKIAYVLVGKKHQATSVSIEK